VRIGLGIKKCGLFVVQGSEFVLGSYFPATQFQDRLFSKLDACHGIKKQKATKTHAEQGSGSLRGLI
jgi:hypothetical protein